MMKSSTKLYLFVPFVAFAAVSATAISWYGRLPSPGVWEIAGFVAVSFLLDQTSNPLRIAATGSISFVIHMAAGILFGGFWGGVISGISTGIDQVVRQQPVIKLIFNVS